MKIHKLAEFQKMAREFVLGLKLVPDRAIAVGLYGELGAGKTTFVQAAAKALGVNAHISSPTFLIFKTYSLQTANYKLLIHVDAYRLRSSEELKTLRFEELLTDPQNLIFVEWAERVADILPKDHIKVRFAFVDGETRSIAFS